VDNQENTPSFEDVADFVRGWAMVPTKRLITPGTQFERDLGITGDDGSELLEVAQERFKVNLRDVDNGYRRTFNLGPDEYLFNSEGWSIGFRSHSVRPFTVGELCDAIQKASSTRQTP
jgi:hypothetical protein